MAASERTRPWTRQLLFHANVNRLKVTFTTVFGYRKPTIDAANVNSKSARPKRPSCCLLTSLFHRSKMTLPFSFTCLAGFILGLRLQAQLFHLSGPNDFANYICTVLAERNHRILRYEN